ncbi:MAG: PTS sugar transporter subunit IIB [Erysipelotrichia bacterium]|nr:PTS sugar transporter subunit IIB [Erysipelotrichia bacterium]
MHNIALVCQHGASTGVCVKKMIEAADQLKIDCFIKAYPDSEMDEIVKLADIILLGPQLAFRKDQFIRKYPDAEDRIKVIPTMDFGMMNGKKILEDALETIETLKGEKYE